MALPENRQYDIIIPVYNGLDFFRACYNSVRKYTPAGQKIVIVDDGGTEPGLKEYFDEISQAQDTIVIHLSQNRGFVHAVNTGMSHSDNHVILLNSDTEVTPNWLSKIDAGLFSAPNVGTVTPWTNKGTICSLPNFCEDNELPEGINANDLSVICEQVCPKKYYHLPTGVGFCMAIRRELLLEIGLFDEDTFGRGYGEENDFCMRAIEHGYVNIHDDQTFIYHKGSMTFSGEKQKLADANLKRVLIKHPNYLKLVQEFIHTDPLSFSRSRIDRLIEHKSGKIHVLYILHNDPLGGFTHQPGGTEHHVLSLADSLYNTNNAIPFILACSGNELVLLEKNLDGGWQKRRLELENKITITSLYDHHYQKSLFEILDIYHIDLVHIHHQLNSPLDIKTLFDGWGGGICITLHEFFAICPSYNLIDHNNKFCNLESPDLCPICIKEKTGYSINLADKWRKMNLHNLQSVDHIYVPSKNCEKIIASVFPSIATKITAREHGSSKQEAVVSISHTISERIRIGFLGGLSTAKGGKIIYELIKSDKQKEIDWILIGEIGDSKLKSLAQENVQQTGRYDQAELRELVQTLNLDLVLLCSIWPETFSYTLSECWQLGLPVIVGPLGAPADRVMKHEGGWVVKQLAPKAFMNTIKMVKSNPEEYSRKLVNVANIPMETVQEMTDQYLTDYKILATQKNLPEFRPSSNRDFWPGSFLVLNDPNIGESQDRSNLARKYHHMQKELVHLRTTLSWRITSPLRGLDAWLGVKKRTLLRKKK